ncbi:response regulator receiver domain [Nitrosomonas ureae]|uniref:Response receiver domain-containing protein n=1 Tax=Nitrosomonas ureae TaxID=44577 RepID=A0A286A518_9PROT|nr:response regulator receiver domain [Nitrosomonas ureae]SOD17006.1 hypothetical protein SAMN06297164_0952 [Nitrosomonas ureae]
MNMMTIPNTVSEFSKYAAQEFLQTAVFIDDRIYERKDGSIPESKLPSAPRSRPRALKSADQKVSSNVSGGIEESDQKEYSPRKIVISFAKKQIICSLYQPEKEAKFSEKSDVFSLCMAADIVIVDWDLHGDAGTKALELVGELIQRAVTDVPEQLRLILVYTDQIDLRGIGEQLYEKISRNIRDENLSVEDDGLAFHTLNSRVSILGKENGKRPDQYKKHEVVEKELADKAIEEFTKLASGLLHAASFLGLAKIRKNSRKILSKFNSSLDPAFLTHRAMSLPDEDAADHLIPLLVSEIEAVLEDSLPKPLISDALIEDWCQNKWMPGDHVKKLLGNNTGQTKVAIDFCLKGKRMRNDHENVDLIKQAISKKEEWRNERNKIREISSILLAIKDSVANHEFSRLMSSRTFYGKHRKDLKLGTIVRQEKNGENPPRYLLCLQPVCDSVRLSAARKFIFAELEEVEQDGKNKASHILLPSDNKPKELLYQPKAFKCFISEFSPESKTKQILTKLLDDGREIFTDMNNCEYVWLDQLKTSHAQRAVEKYARELSRVGLTESEWQRLLDK